ncbi:MAG: amidohydrolase [Bacteroides sp.]|nr:amidohydrolase [Bacteroides sp.]
MDEAGIDMEIVSYTNPTQYITGDDAIAIAKVANDTLASLVSPYPNRFCAFATLPWSNPQAAADELRRTVKEHGFVGTLISGRPQTGNIFLDDPIYYPVWEALTELDLPIYIHPNYTTADVCKSYYSNLGDQFDCVLSTYGYGWHFEAGLQVIRMILSGVFEKYPKLKVISGHWGEMVPYYLPRLDQMFSSAVTGLKEVFSFYYKRNVYVTPSGLYDNDSLQYCVGKLGIDHILFSADFPYIPMTGARPFMENAPLSVDDKEKFGSLNAEKLLHL